MHPSGSVTREARTKQVVLVAFLVELVVVAGLGNQGIAPHTQNYVANNTNTFLGRMGYSLLTLSWRFKPLPNDHQHLLLGSVLGLLTLFAVTALLVFVTVRGPVRFGQALVSVWMAVIVAAGLGGWVRRLVQDGFTQRGTGRITDAVFSVFAGFDFVLGILLGLVVGIIAGAAATSGQRARNVAVDPAGQPPMQQPPQLPVEDHRDRTEMLPRRDTPRRDTSSRDTPNRDTPGRPDVPPAADDATTQLPRDETPG